MLILTRHLDESIVIGDDVVVTVVGVRGVAVRLGVSAPRRVEVDRQEVRARKRQERGRGGPDVSDAPPAPLV